MIVRWTIKALIQARARSLGSILAVGTALLLVITFRAVWEGETEQLAAYIEGAGADVWVMQDYVSNMHMASSFISEGKRTELATIEGVESLSGILYLNTMVEAGGRQWFSYVVGVDEEGQIGAPWSMAEGSGTVSPGEAIIPETLSTLTDTGIGDRVQISDQLFTVVGLSSGTFSVTNPITFVHARDLADLLSLAGYDSYVLIRSAPGVDPADLSARIEEEIDGVAALPTADFVESDIQLASQMGTEVISLMTWICAILATLLVAFSLYIHTSHNRRELAILKALGFENRHVYGSVLIQAVVITGAAFGLAIIAGELLAVAGPRLFPVLSLSISIPALLEIGIAALAIAVTATLAVARRIARVDPISVFSQ
jgi:putative ABC transport system permease protein